MTDADLVQQKRRLKNLDSIAASLRRTQRTQKNIAETNHRKPEPQKRIHVYKQEPNIP